MNFKLEISYDFDFELIGIVSNVRSFKMAWLLNQEIGIALSRLEDIELVFVDGSTLYFANFLFKTENDSYRLIKNKSHLAKHANSPFLLPELKEYDFFLLIENTTQTIDSLAINKLLTELSQIQYSTQIDPVLIKNRENLIF